jgi:hypothetical protein
MSQPGRSGQPRRVLQLGTAAATIMLTVGAATLVWNWVAASRNALEQPAGPAAAWPIVVVALGVDLALLVFMHVVAVRERFEANLAHDLAEIDARRRCIEQGPPDTLYVAQPVDLPAGVPDD